VKLYLDKNNRRFVKSAASSAQVTSLFAKRRETISVAVQFVDSYEIITLGIGATGTIGIKRAYGSAFLAETVGWEAPGEHETAYVFELSLRTAPIEAAFSGGADQIEAKLEIKWADGGEELRSVTLPLVIGNSVILGDEWTPDPAEPLVPVVQFINDVPENKTDFFMFEGGVAPTTGLYQAADGHYNYTIKGGWTMWRRSPIASW